MLCFKARHLVNEFHSINPRLRAMIFELSDFLEKRFGTDGEKSMVKMTSLWRIDDPESVHGHGRGCDFSAKRFSLGNLYEIEGYINGNFPYGDGKHKSLVFHSHNGALEKDTEVMKDPDFHGHLQVKAL